MRKANSYPALPERGSRDYVLTKDLQRIRKVGVGDIAIRPQMYPELRPLVMSKIGREPDDSRERVILFIEVFRAAFERLPSSNVRRAAEILFHLDPDGVAPHLDDRRRAADNAHAGRNSARDIETIRRTLERHIDGLVIEILAKLPPLETARQSEGKEEAAKRRVAVRGTLATGAELATGVSRWSARMTGDATDLGALAMLELPEDLYQVFKAKQCPLSTEAQVEAIAIDCDDYFFAQDAAAGGGRIFLVARVLHHRAGLWSRQSGVASKAANALKVLHANLGAWVGWLAYDAGRIRLAQRYLQDTILYARFIDCPVVEIRAMVCLCLLLDRQGKPDQVLQVAQAALRVAGTNATPRQEAIIRQRVASAYAALGDQASFVRWADTARNRLEGSALVYDRRWLHFVTVAELIGLKGMGYGSLGQNEQAAETFRSIVSSPDPSFHRNNVYYKVQLAKVAIDSGDIAHGTEILLPLLHPSLELNSGRVARHIFRLRKELGSHAPAIPQAREFIEAYDEVIA